MVSPGRDVDHEGLFRRRRAPGELGLVQLVDVLRDAGVEAQVARVGGEQDDGVDGLRVDRDDGAVGRWAAVGYSVAAEADLRRRCDVGNLDHAGGRVDAVLGQERDGPEKAMLPSESLTVSTGA